MGGPLTRLGLVAVVFSTAISLALTVGRQPSAAACGSQRPFEFDTYEAQDYVSVYGTAIQLAAEGKVVTAPYNIDGTTDGLIDLRYQGIQSGPRAARLPENAALRIPPTIFKSIAWIEANWSNGASSVPWGGVGPVLRSFDCGYGVAQVTSGMANNSGTPSARQAIIGTDFVFNLAEGVRILADKWNSAAKYRPIAGNGDPAMLEDWYFAIWSYNGFAFVNHPLNPNLNPLRGGSQSPAYHCYDPSAPSYQATSSGGPAFGYGDYTYQERVYGCMRNPPYPSQGATTVRLWPAQHFLMPDFTIPSVGAAFSPEVFSSCEDRGFGGGCTAAMDFPTTIPEHDLVPHADATLAADPALAVTLLGNPMFQYSGSPTASLFVKRDGTVTRSSLTVTNVGLGIAPFRVRTSAPWIIVRHDTDPTGRTIDGGVAVGLDKSVVIRAASSGQPPIAQQGYASQLIITLDPAQMPPGVSTGTVVIDPLFGGGGTFSVSVTGVKSFAYQTILPGLSTSP